MNILKKIWLGCNNSDIETLTQKTSSLIITFTGGLGAQIISAAIYYDQISKGRKVYADLSYFDGDMHNRIKSNVSIWDWQILDYGHSKESFLNATANKNKAKELKVDDGLLKLRLGIEALNNPEIQKYFPNLTGDSAWLRKLNFHTAGFICFHMRRGDYLNVASHIITDSFFLGQAKKFAKICRVAAILSDSILDDSMKKSLDSIFEEVYYFDDNNISAYEGHLIMRNAKILICSNSQYSLTAALLGVGLTIIPKIWFGKNNESLNSEIQRLSDFMIVN